MAHSVGRSACRTLLGRAGMCVVAVPTALRPILVEHKCCHDEAGPPFVRKLLRQPHPGWPANVDDAQFLLLYCIKYVRMLTGPPRMWRSDACTCCPVACRDLKDDLRELHGLPLVPLANGQLGLFIVEPPDSPSCELREYLCVNGTAPGALRNSRDAWCVASGRWLCAAVFHCAGVRQGALRQCPAHPR